MRITHDVERSRSRGREVHLMQIRRQPPDIIGRQLLDRRAAQGWGTRVVQRLSDDLRPEFAGMRGLATRSLEYMQTFAAAWPDPIAQQPVARLPWGHITVLLDRLSDQQIREWYARQDVEHGWSRAVLNHHIQTQRHTGSGRRRTTSPRCCPLPNRDCRVKGVSGPRYVPKPATACTPCRTTASANCT
jgi:predicted nuclease of restriction endonuclease-like (RecB) superfamily